VYFVGTAFLNTARTMKKQLLCILASQWWWLWCIND